MARSIASEDGALATRVLVNRIWQHHFGRGLVRTSGNFGRLGEKPSHPALLDYLAARLSEGRGSVKAIHREILFSRAYRRSALADADSLRADPENRLIHYRPARRLEAEAIRDALLAASGSLDRRLGGPSIDPWVSPNATANKRSNIPKSGPVDGDRRRSIYLKVRRNFVTPFLASFDFPDQGSSVSRRNVTLVPQQALALSNSELAHLEAGRWGRRLAASDADAAARIDRMFRVALARPPRDEEARALAALAARLERLYREGSNGADVAQKVWTDLAHVLFLVPEFVLVR